MKTIYNLKTSVMNGTVTMCTNVDSFLTRELAEEAKATVEKANEHSEFGVWCKIDEGTLFESRNEVPILNEK